MSSSDTYNMIFEEGQIRQAKKNIRSLGQQRFGPADDTVMARLDAITDLERLKRIMVRSLKAANWQELLDTP
jgi:hypothetical protein